MDVIGRIESGTEIEAQRTQRIFKEFELQALNMGPAAVKLCVLRAAVVRN
jgi:hypothetical protein